MRSISIKLILAFLAVGILSVAVIVILGRWNTRAEFIRFISDRNRTDIVTELTDYYIAYGTWDGADVFFFPGNEPFNKPVSPDYPPRFSPFALTDDKGIVVIAGGQYHVGEQVPTPDIDIGVKIQEDGKTVGILVPVHVPFEGNPREREFINRTNLTFLYSALAAACLALILGIFLSRTLTRPIRELTDATHSVAEGNLGLQVSVHSRDELGALAASFNKMSTDLARSTDARKQMTADIAHELRTPLSLILGHAEAVHDGVLPPSRENFEIIREEAIRLEHLVDDLRILSLADAGELSINLQEVSPEKLLNDIQAMYLHIARQRNVKIQPDVASELPMLNIDPGRMTQVLTNILDNALRHTPESGRITLSARKVQAGVELSVQDSGPGIEGEDVNRIFQRFYRTDASRHRDEGGSGLGLAIAKSIVLAHNGQIWAESAPGKGLTVTVKLPSE
jgi:signal transduction histidine kinase